MKIWRSKLLLVFTRFIYLLINFRGKMMKWNSVGNGSKQLKYHFIIKIFSIWEKKKEHDAKEFMHAIIWLHFLFKNGRVRIRKTAINFLVFIMKCMENSIDPLVHQKRICIDFAKGILHKFYYFILFFLIKWKGSISWKTKELLRVLVISFMPCSSHWEWCVSVLVLLCYNRSNCIDFGKAFNK